MIDLKIAWPPSERHDSCSSQQSMQLKSDVNVEMDFHEKTGILGKGRTRIDIIDDETKIASSWQTTLRAPWAYDSIRKTKMKV